MEEQQQKEHEELITVTGGVELEVAYQNNGEKEIVKVRQIPVSKIGNFIMALANEAEAIELYCDKPKGWADTLKIESASAIADKGQEINLPFFVAWFRRQAKWRDSQQTGAIAEVEKKLQALSSVSAASAQQSPTTTDSPQNR
jgi:hypothetical protein